jgi:hypothetical protein
MSLLLSNSCLVISCVASDLQYVAPLWTVRLFLPRLEIFKTPNEFHLLRHLLYLFTNEIDEYLTAAERGRSYWYSKLHFEKQHEWRQNDVKR